MRQARWGVLALAGALGAVGCASRPELKPAAAANQVPGDEFAARQSVEGVTVVVDGNAWEGVPDELDEVVPVRVTLRNDSGQPLRIRYNEFALVGPEGSRFAALPPLQIDGTAWVDRPTTTYGGAGLEPGFDYEGFYLSPSFAPYWTGITPWRGPFLADPLYYDTYGRWPVELPTQSMVSQALPEGVLEPGGTLSGFIYFEDVPEEVERVRFRMDLVDAEQGEAFGRVSIPFIPVDA